MANIVINEISDNYTYNIGVNSFATVALPITASWGPAVLDPASLPGGTETTELNGKANFEKSVGLSKWLHFPATPQGLDSFVSTFRGPSSTYKINKDYSYQMAITLLTAGYDVLVNRVCSGTSASAKIVVVEGTKGTSGTAEKSFTVKAKYVGTFGNNLRVQLTKKKLNNDDTKPYWNLIVSVIGNTGGSAAVENINFVVDDTWDIPDWIETLENIQSNYISISNSVDYTATGADEQTTAPVADTDSYTTPTNPLSLIGGADERASSGTPATDRTQAKIFASVRYNDAYPVAYDSQYTNAINGMSIADAVKLQSALAMEFNYTAAYFAYAQLQDKLQYAPNRIIAPGWDDQNVTKFTGEAPTSGLYPSPLHKAITLAAYYGRCGAGLLDIPLSCGVDDVQAYADKLSIILQAPNQLEANAPLYNTNYALFAPWGNYRLVGMSKQVHVSPSLLALLIFRAQILNQPIQYEWILPTNKKHNLNIGKLDWEVSKATLDSWQKLEGVSINVIADIPSLGVNVWGNSTLMDVPPATYNALQNLSTRYLMNAVENVIYIVGLSITFTYNNSEALSSFKVGVSPILDTMKNVGAIEGYKIVANPDINGEDRVNAQTIIGQVVLLVNGIVNDIVVDLVALPPNADLSQFGE